MKRKNNKGIPLLIFIVIVAFALYGAVKLVTSEGTQCLANPWKFGIELIEKKNDSPATCTCTTQGSNVYRFDRDGDLNNSLEIKNG